MNIPKILRSARSQAGDVLRANAFIASLMIASGVFAQTPTRPDTLDKPVKVDTTFRRAPGERDPRVPPDTTSMRSNRAPRSLAVVPPAWPAGKEERYAPQDTTLRKDVPNTMNPTPPGTAAPPPPPPAPPPTATPK